MILIIDNYDSFTYNLVHLVGAETEAYRVVRNDDLSVDDVRAMAPSGILISPGPGRPADAGISCALIHNLGPSTPIFGVCLGMQAIGEVYGGEVVHAPELMHGKTSQVRHDGQGVFDGVAQDFTATRYHSLIVDRGSLPASLEISAESAPAEGSTPGDTEADAPLIMGLRHREHPVCGVQFHPESVLTTEGPRLVSTWVRGALSRGAFEFRVPGSE
ncbi:MAG: aminodeoxychorismate/anthranilate synthase component II [Bacteroidota bacterium]